MSGGFAHVDGDYLGMHVISVADPAHPVEVGFCSLAGQVSGVAVCGHYAHVAAGIAGLRIVSVADPASPVEVGYYQTGTAHSVYALGDYAYVVDYVGGLQILEFYGAGVQEMPRAEVRTTKSGPTIVRSVLFLPRDMTGKRGLYRASERSEGLSPFSLLDASGRKVLDLAPGANDVRALATGVYFAEEGLGTRGQGLGRIRKVIITR